jgi:hypothetical protein
VGITRRLRGGSATIGINQLDDTTLIAAIRAVEHEAAFAEKQIYFPEMTLPTPALPYPDTAIWSDATYNVTAAQRSAVARTLTDAAEAHGMLSAGYLEMRAFESVSFAFGVDDAAPPYPAGDARHRPAKGDAAVRDDGGDGRYMRHTQAQCSMTVRHPKGAGSGWAGRSSFDWSAIDGPTLAERALRKCMASLDPVAIEPGRYTVILEPQAVATLVSILVSNMLREIAEEGRGPFASRFDPSIGLWRTKLGLRVADERVTISHDPMQRALGVLPSAGLIPVTWIERGILKNLSYNRPYALRALNENLGRVERAQLGTPSFSMAGGPTSVDEMIASTQRGVLVTRFSTVNMLEGNEMLVTGTTRDGLWLIEHGKVSKAVRNMRFTDSPLFVLNKLEALGPAESVFNPVDYLLAPIVVPTLKANDFAFTSTIDAV